MYDVSVRPSIPNYNEPKLYDYNNTRLPKYPTYDTDKYPNACVYKPDDESNIYILVACVGRFLVDADGLVGPDKPGYIRYTHAKGGDDSWSEPSTNPDSELAKFHGDSIVWSNSYGVNYDNSEPYMEASEMIPVSKYYYCNGFRLPDLPDEVDDFPYVVVKHTVTNTEENTGYAKAHCSTQPWITRGVVVKTTGDVVSYTMYSDPSKMTEDGFTELNKWIDRKDGSASTVMMSSVTWTSHDIVDGNESVAMYASEPVGVSSRYSYNGYEYPALPEWDKTKYPYAHISVYNSQVRLRVFPNHNWYKMSGSNMVSTSSTYVGYYFSTLNSDGEWSALASSSLATGETVPNPVWTNADIVNTDGSIYLSASDPVAIGGQVILYGEPGVDLPKLPDDWDKTTYPYACIIQSSVMPDTYVLFLSSVKFYTETDLNGYLQATNGTLDDKDHHRYTATAGSSSWILQFNDNNLEHFTKIVWVNEQCVYSNVNHNTFWNVSTRLDDAVFKQYEYNGNTFARLPEIAELAMYPFKTIAHDTSVDKYYLYYTSHELISEDGSLLLNEATINVIRYTHNTAGWIEDLETTVTGTLLWSSYDVYKSELVYKYYTYEPTPAMNFLYNGIELPGLPERDTSKFYHEYLVHDATSGYLLYYTGSRLTHSEDTLINSTGADITYEYYKVDGEQWTLVGTDLTMTASDSIPEALWTSVTIYETDGMTVFLDSTEPEQMLIGYLLDGLLIPPLPNYDREKYKYAFIVNRYSKYCSLYAVTNKNFHVIVNDTILAVDRCEFYEADFSIQDITDNNANFRWDYTTESTFSKNANLGRVVVSLYDMEQPEILFKPCSTPSALYNQYRYGGYNGTVFPIIPECDVEKYPYAIIHVPESGADYELYISAERFSYSYEPARLTSPTTDYLRFKCVAGEPYDTWEAIIEDIDEPTELSVPTFSTAWSGNTVFKSSYHVLDYPNYIFVYTFNENYDNHRQIDLYYSGYKHPFTYDSEMDTIHTDLAMHTTKKRLLNKQTSDWSDATESVEPTLTYGLDEDSATYYRIYTNHDILDDNRNVWLAANGVTEFNPKGAAGESWYEWFKEGLAIGLSGLPVPTLSSESPNYVFDPDNSKLIINRDDGKLDFQFNWDTFDLNIREW